MEELDFVLLWKEQYEKIDASLAINKKILIKTINQEAASALTSFKRFKTRGILITVPYLIIIGLLLFYAIMHYSPALNYFIVSFAFIFFINLKAVYDYIRHLIMVHNIDYNGSITGIQLQLSKLQLSIIGHSKIMFLQFPFWTTFFLSSKWFPHSVGWPYILLQITLTAAFAFFAIWVYRQHTVENMDKKWFKQLIACSGGRAVLKAMEFYKELEAFKQD